MEKVVEVRTCVSAGLLEKRDGDLRVDVGLLEKQIDWLGTMPDSDEKEGLLNFLSDLFWALSAHDSEACGCNYLGNDMWSCGHIDNLGSM